MCVYVCCTVEGSFVQLMIVKSSKLMVLVMLMFQPNSWGFDYCDGCRECECGIGSVTPQCGMRTGLCDCQPGVQGDKCDKCMPGHWNLGPNGCQGKTGFGQTGRQACGGWGWGC